MSFTSAAEELNCTQSAVSNHVRSLEDFIGRPLFVRYPRSLSLTDVGEAYLPTVRNALQEIDMATQSLIAHSHKREVVISCPISLAASWLPDVIRGFTAIHHDVDLTIHGTIWSDVDEKISDISISINHIDDIPEGAVRLWTEELTIVCAPDYEVNGQVLTEPLQLCDADMIYILGRLEYWKLVLRELGLPEFSLPSGLRTSATNLAMELAIKGLGCAVVPKSLAKSYFKRGLLTEPFALKVPSPWAYCLQVKSKSPTPTVKQFLDWFLEAAKEL